MPAQLTMIKNKHDEPKQPLVITCTSDSGTFYDSDTDSLQHPDNSNTDEHQSQHPNDTTTHMEADTQAGFLDYPPRQGALLRSHSGRERQMLSKSFVHRI